MFTNVIHDSDQMAIPHFGTITGQGNQITYIIIPRRRTWMEENTIPINDGSKENQRNRRTWTNNG